MAEFAETLSWPCEQITVDYSYVNLWVQQISIETLHPLLYAIYPLLYTTYPLLYTAYPLLYTAYPCLYTTYQLLYTTYPLLYTTYSLCIPHIHSVYHISTPVYRISMPVHCELIRVHHMPRNPYCTVLSRSCRVYFSLVSLPFIWDLIVFNSDSFLLAFCTSFSSSVRTFFLVFSLFTCFSSHLLAFAFRSLRSRRWSRMDYYMTSYLYNSVSSYDYMTRDAIKLWRYISLYNYEPTLIYIYMLNYMNSATCKSIAIWQQQHVAI